VGFVEPGNDEFEGEITGEKIEGFARKKGGDLKPKFIEFPDVTEELILLL
jgi:hypothetical protein